MTVGCFNTETMNALKEVAGRLSNGRNLSIDDSFRLITNLMKYVFVRLRSIEVCGNAVSINLPAEGLGIEMSTFHGQSVEESFQAAAMFVYTRSFTEVREWIEKQVQNRQFASLNELLHVVEVLENITGQQWQVMFWEDNKVAFVNIQSDHKDPISIKHSGVAGNILSLFREALLDVLQVLEPKV